MIRASENGLTLFRFENLSACPGLNHAVFSRLGGSSSPPFTSLNLGTAEGDHPETVEQNRGAVAACFGHRPMAFVKQVHGDDVLVFKKGGQAFDPSPKPRADAMITDIPGLMLAVKLADCQGVLLHDPVKQVAAAVHSGWRGSVLDIIGKTIARMKTDFGCDPGDIMAGISPSLGSCCAEFVNYRTELPESFWPYRDSRDRFDFWQISRDQMTAAGLLDAHIEIADICTRCRTDLFFSYRGEGRTGRFAAVIGMV
ncbi:MAG: peptidoglycan editing factor PgeF [Thermodesulfobacteriota bacterium]